MNVPDVQQKNPIKRLNNLKTKINWKNGTSAKFIFQAVKNWCNSLKISYKLCREVALLWDGSLKKALWKSGWLIFVLKEVNKVMYFVEQYVFLVSYSICENNLKFFIKFQRTEKVTDELMGSIVKANCSYSCKCCDSFYDHSA